jgi:hypothetical protein
MSDQHKTDIDVRRVERFLAHNEIRDVLNAYCHGTDRRDWDWIRRCYHEDAVDSHGAFTGTVDDLVAWLQKLHEDVVSSQHVLSNITVDLDLDLRYARVESYCINYREVVADKDPFVRDMPPGAVIRRTVACRYIDDFEFREGIGWRIAARLVVFDWARIEDASLYLPLDPIWVASSRDKSDAFYIPRNELIEPR